MQINDVKYIYAWRNLSFPSFLPIFENEISIAAARVLFIIVFTKVNILHYISGKQKPLFIEYDRSL